MEESQKVRGEDMAAIIEVTHLLKKYGNRVAVDDISFSVEEGSFFSFLGSNGAGKSTTINLLTTLIQKDAGQIIIDKYSTGRDDGQIRNRIGCVFQQGLLDKKLTVRENLQIRGSFYSLSKKALAQKITELSELIQITEILERPYGKLSGGQKRRADIVRALLNEPKILFLDEPTAGLDPLSRKILWETIRNLRKELGMTVFLTTHYMEEADHSDKIVVLHQGRIMAEGTPAELKSRYSQTVITLHQTSLPIREKLPAGCRSESEGERLTIYCPPALDALGFLTDNRQFYESFEVRQGKIDDVFLTLTAQRGVRL